MTGVFPGALLLAKGVGPVVVWSRGPGAANWWVTDPATGRPLPEPVHSRNLTVLAPRRRRG